MSFRFSRPAFLFFLLALSLLGQAVQAGPPAAGATPSLGEALNPDGTLRAGASGSFDARQFTMQTAVDGRPVFRPSGATGAGDFRWADGFGLPDGVNGIVHTIVCSGTDIYIGGAFSAVGNVAANNVAKWNGTAWSSLGTGGSHGVTGSENTYVTTLAIAPSGVLYVGGSFNQAGVNVAVNNVAKWDGTTWSALGAGVGTSILDYVTALAVSSNGEVFVGGGFTQAGGIIANNVAKWNGAVWSSMGTGAANGANNVVSALAISGSGEVYVGGFFTQMGGLMANHVAKWNGTGWNTLGSGTNGNSRTSVFALAISRGGDVYAGGNFGQVGGIMVNCIAKWNGTTWSALGAGSTTGLNHHVMALALSSSGEVYAGGNFIQAGGQTANYAAKWNGTNWSALGTGANVSEQTIIRTMAVAPNGEVYTGGDFVQAGGLVANNIAKWNGVAWSTLSTGAGHGVPAHVNAVAVAPNGEVYVGGPFSKVGGIAANCVAKWNGTAWSRLGNGVNSAVSALVVAGNGEVFVGGGFTQAGGVAANHVARWNGTSWSALGTGAANGVDGAVFTLTMDGSGNLYAGGGFNQAGGIVANFIAKWNGTVWSALGAGSANGLNLLVTALAVSGNGDLYVGGYFTRAGGQPANYAAKWNGSAWSTLGTGAVDGVDGPVYALAVAGSGEVYVGGGFTQAGGVAANCVAKWNGTSWSALGLGASSSGYYRVSALVVSGSGDVYVGGQFTHAGGLAANRVAKWDGTAWSTLGTGLNGVAVMALCMGFNNKVYVGGQFGGVGDGSKASSCFAIYDPAAVNATASAAPRETLHLTPNPAHGPATLTLPPAATARAGQVLDGLGRVVRIFVVPAQAGTAALPVAGLPAGAYVVRVGAASGRLVVE